MTELKDLKCDVCDDEPVVGVFAVPGVPCSIAYGQRCLDANAHEWGLLVANTSICGGLDQMAGWWKQMVEDTCKHLGKTREQFDADVAQAIKEFP